MKKVVGLDFETETDEFNNCKPILVCLNAKDFEKSYRLTIREEYVEFIAMLLIKGYKYVVFNASFDIEIILAMLLRNGFKFLTGNIKPSHKTMKLIMGQKIYSLSVYYEYKGRIVETQFMDLANLIVGVDLATVAKTFTDLEKGNYEVAKEDEENFIKYCNLDAKITRVAYENVSKFLGGQYLTIGSASFDIMLKMNYDGKSKADRFKQFKSAFGKNTIAEDTYIRKRYAGGLGWCSTDDRTELKVNSYDLKSAYPSVAIGTLPTTVDKEKYSGYKQPTKEQPFAFIHLRITGQVKVNHCPVLPSRNIYGDSNIYIYDDKDVYLIKEYGVKSEYDYFMENIDIEDMEFISTTLMRAVNKNPLEKFMLYYYNLKSIDKGAKRELDKRILNANTGKLGTNPIKENIQYELNEQNILTRAGSDQVEIDTYATQAVAVITSRVRCKCYKIDKEIRDKVNFRLYATDSVKHSNNAKVIETSNELGGWALEHEDTDFIFLGLKAYIFDANNEKGEREVICAGISKKYKKFITNDNFYAGASVRSLVSVRRGNGRVIYEADKRIVQPVKKQRRRK